MDYLALAHEFRPRTMRAGLACGGLALTVVIAVAIMIPNRATAQGMGGGPGGLNSIPSSLFGQDKKSHSDLTGPTLSATNEPVTEIRILGNKTIPTSKILNELQTRVGRPFDPELVQRDVRKLATRGWFVDVKTSDEKSPGGRVVVFSVVERPVIRYVEYLGNHGIRQKKLEKETGLKIGGPVDPYAVEEARRRIIDYYKESGYNHTQVTILEGSKPTDQGVVFVINEGEWQKVWKVEFEGNTFATDRRLRTQIETKPPLMMIFKGFVDREQIEADVEKLTNYYRSFGFFQAKVGRKFEYDDKNRWLTLRFIIHEGPRFNVQNVSFIGNKIFSSESLASITKLHGKNEEMTNGQPFEQSSMNADVELLKELYGSQGYVFADIRAEPIFLEESGQMDLMYHIEEGRQWRVGNIYVRIDGDTPHTRIHTALNRLSIRPGEIVDIREIKASERRLQASGLYMADAARGIMPKITYRIQELGDTELASDMESGGFRGQSPDTLTHATSSITSANGSITSATGSANAVSGATPSVAGNSSSAFQPNGRNDGAAIPLLPPPGSALAPLGIATQPSQVAATHSQHSVQRQTYRIPPPPGFVADDDQIDVYLDFESAPATAQPQLSPQAIRHEVRRYPYGSAAPQPAPVPANAQGWRRPSPTYVAQGNNYQQLVVRGQSPYQAPTSQPYSAAQPATAAATASAPGAYPVQQATAPQPSAYYGGQVAQAAGSNAAPSPYASAGIQQTAISEPSLPPPPGAATTPITTVPASGAPAFGPPPIAAQQYGMPQTYGPAVPIGPPPQALPPSSSITPVSPLPTNPQLFPSGQTDPFTPEFEDPAVDLFVDLNETQTGRLMLGVAVNSDAGLVGQILLDEQNFDWTRYPRSMDEFLSGRAWRGNGERFRLEAAPGTEVQRYLASFTDPYFWDTPVSLGLSGSYFDRRYVDWDEQRLGGRVSLGYQWTENDLSAAIAYRGENINISNISNPFLPELQEVKGDNVLHGFKYTIANDTRDSAFLATQGHYLELSIEQVIGSFDYPRAMIEGRQYYLVRERPDHSGRHVLSASARVGFTGSNTPIYENFFAGGFSTLRGFDFRGASPVKDGVQVGGEFMWVNTVEYLFPLTADDMMHGVVFTDFGTVTPSIELKDFRVSPGLGLRITVPAMGPAPIALDFAFPVLKEDTDDQQIFSFNIGLQR